ncbi:MAG: MBL fold metallo-hydrolase [Polyangiaceae bacterium]|jgi:L-ascorbate metabolism protein UlaG (beta-lactamase superfamily)|nr:MBL fold metallo-hydrolase [Polyangiaceae bacterium]
MFEATYLGNQGWLFHDGDATVVVDPIFGPEFGRGPSGARYTCHPPRRWGLEEVPPLDALIITHEHEDHLHLPSLARVDRRVPVWLSARASRSAHTIVRELGFSVTPLEPGARLRWGGLSLRTFSPNHVASDEIDEWDTLGFAVEDARGDGAFLTNVDVRLTAAMAEHVRRGGEARRAVNGDEGATLVFYSGTISEATSLSTERPPEVGSAHVLDPAEAFARLAAQAVFWPAPGLTFHQQRGRVVRVSEAPFVRTAPLTTWPSPEAAGFVVAPDADPVPACGRPLFDDADLPRLTSALQALASFLYGRTLFRRLLSLSVDDLAGRQPTFLLLLHTDREGGTYAAEYDPSACAFRFLDGDDVRIEAYVGGFECWANDFLALADATFEPRIVSGRHVRHWSALPHVLPFDFEREALWPFFHPLHRPDRCLRRYREVALEERDAPVQVRRRER